MTIPVVVYIHPDNHTLLKQLKAIVGFCGERDLAMAARVETPDAAAQAVAGNISRTVVAATDPRNGLRNKVTAAGGQVLFVRERSRVPTLRDFLGRAVKTGKTSSEIARAIGSETTEISELIKRLGLRKPDDRP